MTTDTIVILTALDLEYEAVHERLTGFETPKNQRGTLFDVGRIPANGCRVALCQVDKGNLGAAVLTERALTEFDPAAVLFVGVAGALRSKLKLGDIVVASHVYAYHGGTDTDDGLKARPRLWPISHAADQYAHRLKRSGEWTAGLPKKKRPPTVHFGPIASGEVVQDSTTSDHARWMRDHYADACAIEMEGAGVAQAAHHNASLPAVIVRGISDYADGRKADADKKGSQPKAARNAAVFALALAPGLVRAAATFTEAEGRTTAPAVTHQNIARDNARVGVQFGQVQGGVRFTQEPS